MKRITLLLMFVLTIMVSGLNAKIIYTDIPDGTPAGIDFNNDGTDEFTIGGTAGNTILYSGGNNIYMAGTVQQGWDLPEPLAAGFTIDASGNFIGFGDCGVTGWGGPNTFPLNQDEFIGVIIKLSGQTHYGWIRLNATGTAGQNAVVTYKDFAYNDVADAPIDAGDIGSAGIGLSEISQTDLSVYPNPSLDFITLKSNAQSEIENITIHSMDGKLILIKTNIDSEGRIDISRLDNGSYIIALKPKKGAIRRVKWIKG